MLAALGIRDVVLIRSLDLELAAGLTVLTGETGAGKSIVLDALGLALGGKADAGQVRQGAASASVTAQFELAPDHPALAYLAEKDFEIAAEDGLVLRRTVSADGRSRAYVNDQAASIGVLRDLGALLLEAHGQHDTVGLLDERTHRSLLDAYGATSFAARTCAEAWSDYRRARERASALEEAAAAALAETEAFTARLAELDRLDPAAGEESELAETRAVLGAAEKTLADVAGARDQMGGDELVSRLASAHRSLTRAQDRAQQAGVGADHPAAKRLADAAGAVDRALVEATEALAAVDAVVEAFDFEPDRLERAEERLFALRAAARKYRVTVDELPELRRSTAEALRGLEDGEGELAEAKTALKAAEAAYAHAAAALTAARTAAGETLAAAVMAELAPLKLDKARFRVAVTPLPPERHGPAGADKVSFEVATNPGAPFGPLNAIASGGELARFALALKAVLASRGGEGAAGPVLVFDEVDQGVGGAVADAVGQRLRRLAQEGGQVLVVTHSPQVAARGDQHWKVLKRQDEEGLTATSIEVLSAAAREEELARMLAGAEITGEARAAARALMGA